MRAANKNATGAAKSSEFINVFSYVGFALAVALMLILIPAQESLMINAAIGAVCAVTGAVIGGWIGMLVRKRASAS